ncbi:MAG: RnfABCDGE type electron transport complex subunit G [Lachnospiraceae bacterium]|nr:RnfABCDGE type electron transport complex subunit G [Lachnospiraceae bacterium]
MKNIVKDTVILLLITLISGVALGAVYNVTKQPRAKQEELAENQAYKNVFPEAVSFEEYSDLGDDIGEFITDMDKKTKEKDENNSNKDINAKIDSVVTALDKDGKSIGYVITVTDSEAYGGDIRFTVGISNEKVIKGISFLSIKETPGLGMRADEDEFKNQFKNKSVDYVKYTKSGASSDNDIDALSGATITSNAVTNGVNAAIYCFYYITGGKADE